MFKMDLCQLDIARNSLDGSDAFYFCRRFSQEGSDGSMDPMSSRFPGYCLLDIRGSMETLNFKSFKLPSGFR